MSEAIALIPIGPQNLKETSGQEGIDKEVRGSDKFEKDFQTLLDLDEVENSENESGQSKEVQTLNDRDEEEGEKNLFLGGKADVGENITKKADGEAQDTVVSDDVAKALIKGVAKTVTLEGVPVIPQTEGTNPMLLEGESTLMDMAQMNDPLNTEKGMFFVGGNTVQLVNNNVLKGVDVESHFSGVKPGVEEGTGGLGNNDILKGADLENQPGWNNGSPVLGQGEENGEIDMQKNNTLGGLKALLDQKTDGSAKDTAVSDGVAKALIKGAAKTATGENGTAVIHTESSNSMLLEGESTLMGMARMNDPLSIEKEIFLVKGSNTDTRLRDLPSTELPLGIQDSGDVLKLASHKVKEVLSFSPRKGFGQYLVEDVGNRVGLSIRGGIGKATISLNPPTLGHLKIDIMVKDDMVKAVIGAENAVVKKILENNLQGLKDALSRQDLRIDELVVLLNDRPAGGGEGGFESREGFAGKDWNTHNTAVRIGEITKDVPSLLNLRKGAIDIFI